MSSGKYQPALLGGLFIGVLSGLPLVQAGNCCCCLWVVSGGLLTTYMLQQRLEGPIENSDAIVSGLLAGVIGAVVALLVGLALAPLMGAYQQRLISWFVERLREMPNVPPESLSQLEQLRDQPVEFTMARHLFWFMVGVPVDAVFGMLGALLGVAVFRKKPVMPAAAPQAPPTTQA